MKDLIYRSRLADPHGPRVVPDILRVARARNAIHGITGVMLFDGERFCQYLEGEPSEVDRLFRSIRHDPRHHEVEVLVEHEIETRCFAGWSMAYALESSRSLIESLAYVPIDEVAGEFRRALPSCDLEI